MELLHKAVKWNSAEIVKCILTAVTEDYQYGFGSVVSMSTFTPVLLTAVYERNVEMVQLLIKFGISPNSVTDNMLPLTAAAHMQDLKLCICLIKNGARIIQTDQCLYSPDPVATAIQAGWDEAVNFLLKNLGADPNASVTWNNMVYDRDILDSGSRLLHLAIAKHKLTLVESLVEMKASISLTDSSGNNALHIASKDCNVPKEIIEYLLKCDAAISSKIQGKSQSNGGNDDDVENGSGEGYVSVLNAKNKEGMTPLMLCCKHRNISGIEILLHNDAKVNLKDSLNKTALCYAAQSGLEDAVFSLIRSGASLSSGNTWFALKVS